MLATRVPLAKPRDGAACHASRPVLIPTAINHA